jgi:DNA-binding transcriptional LysR family regulator
MILNINQLRAFYLVGKTGSVSKAAQELMVTPPAITMQVKQLEETVGIRLMVRQGNAVQPTRAGEELYKKAERIFQEIHDTESFLEDISRNKRGELRIACPEMPGVRVPKLIAEYKRLYPAIKIIVDQGSDAENIKSVEDRRNELVVVWYRPSTARMKVKAIGKEKLVLVASAKSVRVPGDQISVRDLAEIPMLLKTQGSASREVVIEYLRKFKIHPPIASESSNVAVIKEMVGQDEGIAFLKREAVEQELNDGSLKIVHTLEGSPVVEVGIGYRNRRELSPAAWAFLRLVEKCGDLSSRQQENGGDSVLSAGGRV